jgi:abortive infection bacteriophage resistance protein
LHPKGTSFRAYEFDRELRLLTLDAIERIEISLRANINDYMSENFGIFWYLDKKLFLLNTDKKISIYNKLLLKIEKIQKKSGSIFVKHYFKKYDEKKLPSWMLFEELTI